MIFPYKKTGGSKYGPVVPVALKGKKRWIPFNAFVDTGADYSVFHADIAILMGIKLTSGEKKIVTVGDGDDMTTYLHKVKVYFADFIFNAAISFSSHLGVGFNLIGRKTFFEKFQFCFNDRFKIVRVTHLK